MLVNLTVYRYVCDTVSKGGETFLPGLFNERHGSYRRKCKDDRGDKRASERVGQTSLGEELGAVEPHS